MKINVTITNKVVENMMKYSSIFRDKDELKSHLMYRFNDDVMFTSLINQIEEYENFYVLDFIFDICYFVHKINECTYDVLYCHFDDANIPYIKGAKGIKIRHYGTTEYIPIIMGERSNW